MSTVKQLYSTCTTAMTKMNMWSWWRPSVDITCTYPCNQPQKRCGSLPQVLKLDYEFLTLLYRTRTGQWSTQERNVITPTGVSCLFSSCFWSRATSSSWSPLNELLEKLEPLWGQPRWREKLRITHRSPFQVGKPFKCKSSVRFILCTGTVNMCSWGEEWENSFAGIAGDHVTGLTHEGG